MALDNKKLQEQVNILGMFHDGIINKINKTEHDIEIVIEIRYLAEIVNPNYSCFWLQLKNTSKFNFEIWNNIPKIILDIENIAQLDLIILSAENYKGLVRVSCACKGPEFHGGYLNITAEYIKMFDQMHNPITLEKLSALSDEL